MQNLGKVFLEAAAGFAAITIAGMIYLNLRWLLHSKRQNERILIELLFMKQNVTTLFRLQGPQLMGLKATLEAQRDGHSNGSLDRALNLIEDAKSTYDEHLLSLLAVQNEKEKAA